MATTSTTDASSVRQPRRRVARGQARPRYLAPQDIDRLAIMFVALMAEVSALRDRLDTHELLADAGMVATGEAIEAAVLSPERLARREEGRHAMLKRVLRVVTEETAPDGESA
ncbi:hypothetical protein [Novosphingobium sp.]|uniref:hypothetical protein n=1 Tax=Novosphingobium sp. TaxID=1874826 RepID=UPI0025DBF4D3|nr:hypothetical protein [Novosphingobium sp.]